MFFKFQVGGASVKENCEDSSSRGLDKRRKIWRPIARIVTRQMTRDENVVQLMNEGMDEFTPLGNSSTPVDTSLIIVVAAEKDAYVPRQRVVSISELWPEAETRYIPHSGHIQATLFYQAGP